jgi:hypothetical protein
MFQVRLFNDIDCQAFKLLVIQGHRPDGISAGLDRHTDIRIFTAHEKKAQDRDKG